MKSEKGTFITWVFALALVGGMFAYERSLHGEEYKVETVGKGVVTVTDSVGMQIDVKDDWLVKEVLSGRIKRGDKIYLKLQ